MGIIVQLFLIYYVTHLLYTLRNEIAVLDVDEKLDQMSDEDAEKLMRTCSKILDFFQVEYSLLNGVIFAHIIFFVIRVCNRDSDRALSNRRLVSTEQDDILDVKNQKISFIANFTCGLYIAVSAFTNQT